MLKTAFSYAVEWGLLLKSPIPREAPKSTSEERAIWDEKTMLVALQTMTDPTLHLAVHLSMILSLRVGEILGLQPGDIDFDAADGRGTITVGRSLQRTEKAALEKTDPNQIYHIFPDQREGSSSALVLKKPKTKKSSRTLYLTKPLKEELLAWLEKLRQDELAMDGRYRNCGQLFRLPNGMPVAPEALSKWYRTWRAEHPEFEKIVFHGLRHSSALCEIILQHGNIRPEADLSGERQNVIFCRHTQLFQLCISQVFQIDSFRICRNADHGLLCLGQIQCYIIGDLQQLCSDVCTGSCCPLCTADFRGNGAFFIDGTVIAIGYKCQERQVNVPIIWLYVYCHIAAGAVVCLNDLIPVCSGGRSAVFQHSLLCTRREKRHEHEKCQ